MFKFETKPVMGKLQICVSKETRTTQKEIQQRRPLSGQKLKQQPNHRCSDSQKLQLRPSSTPQVSSINLLDKKNLHAVTTNTIIIDNSVIRENKNSIETIGQCQNTDDKVIVGTTIEQYLSKSIHTNDTSTSSNHIACQTYSPGEEAEKTSVGCSTEDIAFSIVEPQEIENVSKDFTTNEGQLLQPDKINHLLERDETSKIPKKMSLLEQKRLQWAAEREQMLEWNPWGRPGGGAPHFTYTCSTTNKSNLSNTDRIFNDYSNDNVSKQGGGGGGRLPPLQLNSPNSNPTSFRILRAATYETVGLIDNSAVLHNCPTYDALKEKSRRQWLEDLERQREEQRLRKMQDKSYYHKNLNDMNIENTANNLDSYSNNHQLTKNNEADIITSVLSPTLYSAESDNWNCNNSSLQRTFLRGANIPLDPETQKELTKKREMALEHQKAIQNQLEDRLRMKREEKERQRKEELEEELRLRLEREQMEQQFVLDQQQQQLKSSHASPEHAKCVQPKEIRQPPSKPQTKLSPQLPDVLDGTKQLEIKPTKVNPTEQDLNDSQEYLLRPPSINHTPYVNNRVLTPTKYREKRLFMRDFSTQTDFMPKGTFPLRKNKSTITMKAARMDDDSDTNSNETSNNDRVKQRIKTKMSRKKLNREKPRWGVNQPTRNYKSQSEKYLSGEVKSNQRKTKEQQQEYIKTKVITDDEKTKSRQRPSGKTRSSAEHQRKLLAQEEGVTLNSQRICLTPLPSVRPMATGSSVTYDERNTGESLPTRRQRRQWQSPSRDEMPSFYTDSPLLPDVRNVRRGITSNNEQSKDQQRRPTSQSLQLDTLPEPYRSGSPPVPALRNKSDNPNMDRLSIKSPAISLGAKSKDKNLASGSDLTEVTEDTRPHNLTDETTSIITERLSRFSVNDAHRSYTAPSHFCSVSSSPSSSLPWQAQNYDDRVDILKKLTLVRQGLVLKQKQLEDMVVTEPKPKEPYS